MDIWRNYTYQDVCLSVKERPIIALIRSLQTEIKSLIRKCWRSDLIKSLIFKNKGWSYLTKSLIYKILVWSDLIKSLIYKKRDDLIWQKVWSIKKWVIWWPLLMMFLCFYSDMIDQTTLKLGGLIDHGT